MKLTMLLILIYIIGLLIWIKIEKKYLPYKKGDYTIEQGEIIEITPEMHKCDAIVRSILWPICLAFTIITLLLMIINIIYKKL